MLCKELILPRDFGNCTDIERSKAQPRVLRGAAGRRLGSAGGRALLSGMEETGRRAGVQAPGAGAREGGRRDGEDEGKTRK